MQEKNASRVWIHNLWTKAYAVIIRVKIEHKYCFCFTNMFNFIGIDRMKLKNRDNWEGNMEKFLGL